MTGISDPIDSNMFTDLIERHNKKKYWYLITIRECPVCGRYKTIRERQYIPKPEDIDLRVKYEEYYDHCVCH
jgi:hypothetical protein